MNGCFVLLKIWCFASMHLHLKFLGYWVLKTHLFNNFRKLVKLSFSIDLGHFSGFVRDLCEGVPLWDSAPLLLNGGTRDGALPDAQPERKAPVVQVFLGGRLKVHYGWSETAKLFIAMTTKPMAPMMSKMTTTRTGEMLLLGAAARCCVASKYARHSRIGNYGSSRRYL